MMVNLAGYIYSGKYFLLISSIFYHTIISIRKKNKPPLMTMGIVLTFFPKPAFEVIAMQNMTTVFEVKSRIRI